MAVLRVQSFGGQMPRVPPRLLPAGGAQRYENLLTTATEFRPLAGDKVVGVAPLGARTLHRFNRDAAGHLHSADDAGWRAEAGDKSYVRGQLNDDETERTAVCWNDGTQRPRMVDAQGGDRLLGVPAPLSVGVNHNEVDQFTADKALAWVDSTFYPSLAEKLAAALVEARVAGGVPVAGPYSLFGRGQKPGEPWVLEWAMTRLNARAAQLDGPELGGRVSGDDLLLPVAILPHWGRVANVAGLAAAIQTITNPVTGEAIFDAARASTLAATLAGAFDPAGDSLKGWRQRLDEIGREFSAAMGYEADTRGPRPEEPTKPNVPEYPRGPAENTDFRRDPQWVAYDAALAQWRRDLAAWEAAGGRASSQRAAHAATLQLLQSEALQITQQIEREYFRRKDAMQDTVRVALSGTQIVSGEGGGGLIVAAPDRIIDTRFYIVTYVTDRGEESAPSPVSPMLEVDQNDSVTITVPQPPADRHVQKWRIYRSNTGSQTSTFQFVEELLIGTPSYNDALKPSQLGEPCPTMDWAEPPYRQDSNSASAIKPPKGPDPYLRGLVGMPNGVLAGFIDNFVAFCHPYHPYAWPVAYQITTEFPIVGLGVFGQSLFVGTMGSPYIISGADSASMTAEKLDSEHACVSRRSIASVGNGVVYASPDGLCLATRGGVTLLTGELWSREDWQALGPENIMAAVHEGVYYFWTTTDCWALDLTAKRLGRVTGAPATAVVRDTLTDHLYVAAEGEVRKLFAEGRREAVWRSGRSPLPAQAPLAWLQVDGDQDDSTPVFVQWVADGEVRYNAAVTGIAPKRLPPGRYLEHELTVRSKARVTRVLLTSSTEELKST